MFRYNLRMAFRNQAKNKLFSMINVLGLAIGMAVSVLIFNYVSFEFSFDKMHLKRDRIYRVESRFYEADQLTDDWATSTFGYGSAISREMTGVEDFVRIGVQNTEQVVSYRENRSRDTGIAYTGPSFFSVFDFKLKEGAVSDQLKRPRTVVITEEVAKRFFKGESPVGKLLTFASGTNFSDYEVTGVMENFPSNSHIRFNYLISYETLPNWMKDFWYLHEAYTYLLLSPGKDPKEIEDQFPAMAEKYKTLPALKNKKWAVTLLPIEKIHLNPQKQYEREVKGNKSSLNTLIIIALVILLTAWINYINLATARAMERARDVGLRKVVGALRTQLASQFILESWLVNMAAFVLAFILVVLFKEAFNRIIGENIGLYLLKQPVLWISAILVLVSGIFLSGYYPAFIMSKVKPSVILKGNYFNFGSAGMTRRILVIFQFAAALFLMCGTFIIYRQIKFMEEQDLGVNVNQTLVVKFPVSRAGLENQVNLFAENLRQENTVRSVTLAGAVPGMEVAFFASNQLQGNSSDQGRLYEMLAVDDHFVETFRLKLLAGRSFQKGFGNDRESLLVNEASLATLGISNPEAAIGQRVMLEGELLPVTIIGVVQNWHQRGLGNSYTPVMFVPNGHLRWVKPRFIAIKTAGDKSEEVLRMVKDRWQSYFPEASFDYFFLDGFFDSQYKTDRRFSRIVAIFTVIAFFISALGLWALASFTASKKVKEVGVRKVLGAQTGSIIVLFSKEIIMLIMVSLVVSTPISYLVMKNWLQHYAFRTEISLWIYFLAGVISIYIALLTIGWQSWKAATRNPVEALRYE